MLLNIIFLANKGSLPLRTILSDHAEVPIAPKSATKNGIHPNIPICAKVKPLSSCKYPGSQKRQKYQTGSLTKRINRIPHKVFVFHSWPQVNPYPEAWASLSPIASLRISAGGSV